MTAILKAAEAALSLQSGESPQVGNLNGKKVTHWSYKVLTIGAVVGAIAALASVALGVYGVTVLAATLFATNALGAFYLKRFSTYHTLEDYIKALTKRIKEVAGKTNELDKINDELGKIDDQLQQVPENWKKEIDKGEEKFKKVRGDLAKMRKKYDKGVEELKKVGKINEEVNHAAGELAAKTKEFSEIVRSQNEELGDQFEKLSQELLELQAHNQELVESIKNLDEQNDDLVKFDEAFDLLVERLKKLFTVITKVYTKIGLENQNLAKNVEKLEAVNGDIIQEMQKALKVADSADQLTEALKSKEISPSVKRQLEELGGFAEAHAKQFARWRKKNKILE